MAAGVVVCNICGQEWDRDPALMVSCPVCNAQPGKLCVRPSGHAVFGKGVHDARDRKSMAETPGYGRCPGKQLENI